MREKRGRRRDPNQKTLDPVGEDDESRVVTGKDGKGFFACYILTSLSPRHKGHTYIGFTVNPKRRIRQHNGEIRSGAFRTKKKRPWEMVLCIFGFPTNVSALQFEWAWQHPRESRAVREAAAAFKSFSGLARKIKLAYTMLTLPAWNSLNLTVNYFSSKYAHHGGGSPSLPPHMKVQVCAMGDLPCFTKGDNNSQPEDEESTDSNEEEDDYSSNQIQPRNPTTISLDDFYPGKKDLHGRHFEKAKEPEAVLDDRLANFTGFGLLDESDEDEDEVSGSTEAVEKEHRVATFNGFSFEKIDDDEVSYINMGKDCWRRSNLITSTTEVEVIDLMTPSPSCRVGSSMKRPRVSEFIDLTRSPSFIELRMNTPMSMLTSRGRVLPFSEKERTEEETGTLESSLLQLIEDNRRSSLQLREKTERSRKEAIRHAARTADLLVKAVNGGVEECFLNEKRIEAEIRSLAVTVARFGKQTDQWLAATHAVNSAVKEIGDFENWMKTMEFDCKKITAAIRNIHEDH
ncbi:unnamed protein product [Brassica rapa]|uniref:Structure-specific endonuclease subunit SLX1 homolog n=2 Tax=Brassica campestris TaxID=3711 RepID=A0A8D9LN28_BRACM|nr:unnamed protein product [Brassica rapa]